MRRYGILILLTLFITSLVGCSVPSSKDAEKYVKDKYGFDINILLSPTFNEGNMGDSSFSVQRKDIPTLTFSIDVKANSLSKITGDDYKPNYKFYQYNQKYMKSNTHTSFKDRGYKESFLKAGYGSKPPYDKLNKVSLYLFKTEGWLGTENELETLQKSIPLIKELEFSLSKDNYILEDITIGDIVLSNIEESPEYYLKAENMPNSFSIKINELEKFEKMEVTK